MSPPCQRIFTAGGVPGEGAFQQSSTPVFGAPLFAIRKIRSGYRGYCYRQACFAHGGDFEELEGAGSAKARRSVYSFIRFRHCGQVWVYSFRMTVVNGGGV